MSKLSNSERKRKTKIQKWPPRRRLAPPERVRVLSLKVPVTIGAAYVLNKYVQMHRKGQIYLSLQSSFKMRISTCFKGYQGKKRTHLKFLSKITEYKCRNNVYSFIHCLIDLHQNFKIFKRFQRVKDESKIPTLRFLILSEVRPNWTDLSDTKWC